MVFRHKQNSLSFPATIPVYCSIYPFVVCTINPSVRSGSCFFELTDFCFYAIFRDSILSKVCSDLFFGLSANVIDS